MDGAEHLLPLLLGVERKVLRVAAGFFCSLGHHFVEGANYVLNPGSEITVVVDVSYELVGQQRLPWSELEQADLIAQVIAQVARRNGYWLEVLTLLVFFNPDNRDCGRGDLADGCSC